MNHPLSEKTRCKSYWHILSQDILSNKPLMFLAVFTGILCFGFTITNLSIGIDDPARSYYLYSHSSGNMIQQGRLLHIAINALTHSVQFIPFFTELMGASLYVLSALLLSALFLYVTDGKLSAASLSVFSCVYISSSILAEKYIYHLDVLATMVSYCCTALALLYAFRFVKEKKWALFLGAVPLLMGAISSYESFIFLYISGVFALFLLEMVINGEKRTFRQLLTEGLTYAAVLLAAMAAYYALVFLLQALTGQLAAFSRDTRGLTEELGAAGAFLCLTQEFLQVFADAIAVHYLPIAVFCGCAGLGAVLFCALSLRRKNPLVLLCYAALFACNFCIHYAAGAFLYRAAQTFCFFCGFVLLMLLETVPVPAGKKLITWAAALLVFVQAADMNRWFYNDYVRYQKEAFAIHAIANEIQGSCDTTKPVVFTNAPYAGSMDVTLYPGRQVNGNSLIYWTGYAFNNKEQPFVREAFRMHGYDFILSPTEDQYDRACLEAETMPVWPQEGSVAEFEDFIAVNFG